MLSLVPGSGSVLRQCRPSLPYSYCKDCLHHLSEQAAYFFPALM